MTQKLIAKKYPYQDILTIVTRLVEAGLISDVRFTENYIRWRRGKGFGPLRITVELQARGVHAQVIAEQLQITDNAWFTEARNVWLKHFKGKVAHDLKSRAQQIRFLQYRGFTREHIQSLLKTEDSSYHHDHEEDHSK